MNQNIKNLIGYAVIFAILIFSYVALNFVNIYSRAIQPSSFRSFSVTGEGKAIGSNDIIEFTYGIVTEGGMNLTDLRKQHDAKSNKVIGFIKSKGIGSDDIKTEVQSTDPRYQYYQCGMKSTEASNPIACPPPKIVGFTIRESVLVKIRDIATAGDILGGVVENGANEVSQLNSTIDDPTKFENQARGEAITKAKAKAEAMASAGGFKLGRLLSISEGNVPRQYFAKTMLEGVAGAPDAAPSPVIAPGSQDISITVTLTYEII